MVDLLIIFLTIVEIILAILIVGIILIQPSKAGGGLGALGGGMTESVLGANAGNVLTKTTSIMAGVFLGITLLLAIISGHRQQGGSVADSPAAVVETTIAKPVEKTTAEQAPKADGIKATDKEAKPVATEESK
jgi:preprotein translocase subunit SecG